MSTRHVGILVTALAAVGIAAVGGRAVDDSDESNEREISLEAAPEAIRNALRGVDVDEIEVETENGQTVYDVVLEIDDGEIELELTAEARLIGVEVEEDDEGSDREPDDGA